MDPEIAPKHFSILWLFSYRYTANKKFAFPICVSERGRMRKSTRKTHKTHWKFQMKNNKINEPKNVSLRATATSASERERENELEQLYWAPRSCYAEFFCDCWKNDVWCDVLRGAGEDISVRFLYYTFVHTFSKSKLMMENCFFERKKSFFCSRYVAPRKLP